MLMLLLEIPQVELLRHHHFKVPTINIGDRQKGRIFATSIINCKPREKDIINAINQISSFSFKKN